MANTSQREKTIKELFIGNCWEYLNNNFHKFSEQNKIKIALELCKKDIPQEVKADFQVNSMPTIQKKTTGEAQPVSLTFNIGSAPRGDTETTEDPGHTGEAPSAH